MNSFQKPSKSTSMAYTIYANNIGKSNHVQPDKTAIMLELLKQNTELTRLCLVFTQEVAAVLIRQQQTLSMLQGELNQDQ